MIQELSYALGLRKRTILTLENGLIVVVLCILGVLLTFSVYQKITQSYDKQAVDTVRALSTALDTDELRALSGTDLDAKKPEYLAMKERLFHTFSATFDTNAAYFLTLRDDMIYFMVDSEPIESAVSSPPGQPYTDAPPEAYRVFIEAQPLVTERYTDRWGDWTSAYILLPSQDGGIPIVFGLDYSGERFYTLAKWRTFGVVVMFVVLLVLFLVISLALRNIIMLENEKKKAYEATSLLHALQEKDLQEKLLVETTLHSLGEAVISCDVEGRVVLMNRMAQHLTGWDFTDALGKPLYDIFHVVDGQTLKPFEKSWPYTVLKTGIPIPYDNREVRLIQRNGSSVAIEDMVSPILDEVGTVTGVVVIFVDATEKRLQKDELLYLSTHDGLTGLLNRQAFYAQVHALDLPKKYPLVLMLLDINGLKLINEAYGHTTGDSLLNEIAIILQRPWHTAQMVGRVDGDEFAIVFPNATEAIAKKVSYEIQQALSEKAFSGYALSISIGYAKKEYAQTSIEELHKKAEDDLFRNKFVENQSARQKMVDLLLQSLFKKSTRELEHSKRVGSLAKQFGLFLSLPKEEVEALHTVGFMHDIGKIAIASKILNKEGKLDQDEWKEIRRHPEIGFNILSSVNEYALMAKEVLCHHERWDGKGYPNQIAGDLIPYYSRILTLCDSFDAMTHFRTYRQEVPIHQALDEIRRCSGTQFDPTLADKFIEMLQGESGVEMKR